MKIFISHSSKDKFYGQQLVELLINVGVKKGDIIFTSNGVHGIPIGQNIFEWLKSQITSQAYVIFLLSPDYYKSIACLNEMGAAWIIENKQVSLFTPNFDLTSEEFHGGAIDPRKVGFFINDEDRIFSFIQSLNVDFDITTDDFAYVNQQVKKFLSKIRKFDKKRSEQTDLVDFENPELTIQPKPQLELFVKFSNLITNQKFKEEELLLLNYIIDTGSFKLKTGWQEKYEIADIEKWEEKKEIGNTLSKNYPSTLKRFELGGFIEVSEYTSYSNPKEFKIKDEISQHLIDLPENVISIISESVYSSHVLFLEKKDLSQRLFLHEKDVWDYIYKFSDILIKNFPKNESGIVHSDNLRKIDKLFQSIKDCEEVFDDQLWWHNGSSNGSFKLTNRGGGIWGLNSKELTIVEIWIHYDLSFYNDFIIVHFKKGEPFIINGDKKYYNVIVDGKHEISYSEYENGYAELNDDVIDLSLHNVELVERMEEDGFLIIGTKYHCALNRLNDTTVIEFIKNLKTRRDKITISDFQDFESIIRVHIHSEVEMGL
jgi:hypothetical protein